MPDRVSVMSWLEGLTQDDWRLYHSDSEVQEIARNALALLEEQERPGWVSVQDRLPEHDDRVPVLYRFADSYTQDGKLHTSMIRYVREPLCWDEPPHWERIGRYEYEVLYWFELPEQPEVVQE